MIERYLAFFILFSRKSPMRPSPIDRRKFLRGTGTAALSSGWLLGGRSSCSADESTGCGEISETSYREPAREIPIAHRADVVVCGAGPAGVTAAIAASRAGARTQLIDVNGCLGGIWTAGLLGCLLDHANKQGIMREIVSGLEKKNAWRYGRLFDPEMMKILLEEMCAEANVVPLLHTRVVAAAVDAEHHLQLALTESKSGRQAVRGKIFLDTTGDGDLAVQAGCGFDYGRSDAEEAQPMSFIVMLTGIRTEEVRPYVSSLPGDPWGEPKDRLAELIEQTTGHGPSYGKPTLFPFRDDLFVLMATHQYGLRGFVTEELTRATLMGRKEIHRMIDGLRGLGGPWKDLRICNTPEHIGVRASRRIHGRYTITSEDIIAGRTFDDAVCRCRFGVDVHSTNPDRNKGIDNRGVHSKPYDIPFRSLLARDVENLMMAGRCISGDFYAHSSYRVTGNSVATGEAAGVAAAMAAKQGVMPAELPWGDIEKRIAEVRERKTTTS
jgi:hypothetical protein